MVSRYKHRHRAVVLGCAVIAGSSFGVQALAQELQRTEVEEVLVTGSRIAREGLDTSTPVSVISVEDIKLSGAANVEKILSDAPQFVGSTNGGASANTVPGGTADVNLRGFGASRNLVLVNGRRFAIYGPEQVTDLNTIPTALIERTEVVTGGSSAVYGSDAITGVVNFIMRDDFEGVEATAQTSYDSPTSTPTYNIDVTAGGNFADGRGNAVISVNYLNRGSISRGERGEWAFFSLSDGCVTPASASRDQPGVPVSVPSGSTCRAAGGVPGLIAGGSGDIPNGRFTGVPVPGSATSNPGLNAALAAAGLGGMTSRGFTFDNAGGTVRPALTPQDDFNLGPDNYLQVPQERWMVNGFSHFDFTDKATGYLEFHFSNNRVDQQLAPTNIGGPFLFNINNPYLTTQMQEVLRQLDIAETAPTTVTTGTSSRVNNPNDGFAVINVGRRLVEVGLRENVSDRNVWRMALGMRGDIGDVSENFLSGLAYDVYYTFARTEETSRQSGNVSRSRFQAGLLSSGGAAPLLNIFGQNLSPAAVNAISIGATNVTEAELQVAAATLSGQLFDLPAGPLAFSFGAEWRYASSKFVPDEFLRSGDVVGFNPGLPTEGDVTAKEVFGELRIPILTGLPFVDNLAANAAFRRSDYDLEGVGDVWTYLYGLDWRLNETVAFRGQFQRAIRAPNVADLFGGLRQSVEPATDPCSDKQPASARTDAVRALCIASGVPAASVFGGGVQPNTIIPALFGGNPNVGEEESDTRTFGVVLTPSILPKLAVTLDYFDITLDGAIAQLGGGLNNTLNLCYNIIQDINSEFCQAINRNPVTGEISVPFYAEIRQANTGGLATSGFDLIARYGFDFGWGLFGNGSELNISTAWTRTDEFTLTPVQAFPNVKNRCVGSYGTTCGEPIPEFKGVTRFTWINGPLSLSLRHRYIDDVTVDRYLLPLRSGATPPTYADLVNPKLRAYNYLDFSFSFDVGKSVEIFGGVNNLLDDDPPVVGSAQIRANTWPATYDYNGRQMFIGMTVRTL
ncbi:TonB-dependent receptor domain-containing protein [Steroidobacter sp.]|uniref:TonB-dependent receptor domain-containing protein n=1 Tax=Steroidobacter sp. TaxID=1978227 RepID=UPI001A4B7D6D|nr:TonB-dependent receptor [Steroidobacter sp.]MBL8268785.1 TonB-dependent receptor [Steroidobacter sp.]